MNIIGKLLRKNTSPARIAGFMLSNFLGLAIILGGLQFFMDARSIWEDDDSFIRSDYMVINKRVTSENTFGGETGFTADELEEIENQQWVKRSFDLYVFRIHTGGFRGCSRIAMGMARGKR